MTKSSVVRFFEVAILFDTVKPEGGISNMTTENTDNNNIVYM